MITNKYDIDFKKYLAWWGKSSQLLLCMEECAELTKECSKAIRSISNRDNMIEELADVYMMVREMEIVCDCEEEVNKVIKEKNERTKQIMLEEQKGMKQR